MCSCSGCRRRCHSSYYFDLESSSRSQSIANFDILIVWVYIHMMGDWNGWSSWCLVECRCRISRSVSSRWGALKISRTCKTRVGPRETFCAHNNSFGLTYMALTPTITTTSRSSNYDDWKHIWYPCFPIVEIIERRISRICRDSSSIASMLTENVINT